MANNLRVVIAAAGKGKRMESNTNKQYMLLNSRSVISYSLDFFERINFVDQIVIIAAEDEIDYCQREVVKRFNYNKVSAVITGGKERQDSVWSGLEQLASDTSYVAVHDGARPLLTVSVFERLWDEAQKWGAAIPGVLSKDTLKIKDKEGFVKQTLDRAEVYSIQTPQIFRYDLLKSAYEKAYIEGFYGTDDASLFERYIGQVKIVEGDYNNIKITTPADLIVARGIIEGLPQA